MTSGWKKMGPNWKQEPIYCLCSVRNKQDFLPKESNVVSTCWWYANTETRSVWGGKTASNQLRSLFSIFLNSVLCWCVC